MDDITQLFNLYQIPPGRRIHAMEEVRDRAIELGLTTIAEHAKLAIAQDHKTLDMQRLRRAERTALYGEDAVALDNQVDRGVNALEDYLILQMHMFPVGHPRSEAAGLLHKELYPQGARAITTLAYVQEYAEVDGMLALAKKPALAPSVALLPDAEPLLGALAELNQRYGASLDAYPRVPSGAEIRAAKKRGQELMIETISMIISHFAQNPSADQSKRDYLIEPILRQNNALREERRRRRAPLDTEPDDTDTDLDLEIPEIPNPQT